MSLYEKWTMPVLNWNLALSQLVILTGRLNNVISLWYFSVVQN